MSASLILCATNRLAQTRRAMPSAVAGAWLTPPATTIAHWLAGLAEEAHLLALAELPEALDAYGEALLWEQVIENSLDDPLAPLFDAQGMAATAAEAHALLRTWDLRLPSGEHSPETRRFADWQAAFEKRCRQGGWIDLPGFQRKVIELIESGHFRMPDTVELAGFDRPTPLEQRLFAALQRRGAQIVPAQPPTVDRRPPRAGAFSDVVAECRAVARWVQSLLAARPDARIGIVAPDLAGVRERLEFTLEDLLSPALIRPDAAEQPRLWNVSLGYPLADLPLIRVALDLLALAGGRQKLEQAQLEALLLSDHWSAAISEADARALLAALMRQCLSFTCSPQALLALGRREDSPARQTLEALGALLAASDSTPRRRQAPGQWSAVFRAWLQAAAWPGERPLSSHEYQAQRAFYEVIDSLARLDAILGPVSLSEALQRLRQLARQRVFQAETRGRPAIQILGVLESAGLDFDALWVMGMNDDLWPPAPRPNPLLPAELLRQAGAAHASAEVELDFARRVHARWLLAAPEVRFSWRQRDGNRTLRPSPLLAEVAREDFPAEAVSTVATRRANLAGSLCEEIADALAPPLAAGEKVSGGTWLLRAQAICPAWGFYQYRLGAEAMERPVEGLDPAARGTLVHGMLEAFWRATPDSAALAALQGEARQRAIQAAVDWALADFEETRRLQLPARFRQLEAARLSRLLGRWLRVEEGRGAPFAVIACEQPAELEIEGIRVRMVVDRIDQLDDGSKVIIDYKTGRSIDTKNWASARLSEPQLPIYAALVAAGEVAAVAFAKVLPDKPAFAGVGERGGVLPGVAGLDDARQKIFPPGQFADWPAVLAHWQSALRAVALEVGAGLAGVQISDEKQLAWCEVLPLLRLPERQRALLRAIQAETAA